MEESFPGAQLFPAQSLTNWHSKQRVGVGLIKVKHTAILEETVLVKSVRALQRMLLETLQKSEVPLSALTVSESLEVLARTPSWIVCISFSVLRKDH